MFSYILKHDDDFSVFRMKQKLKLKVKISSFFSGTNLGRQTQCPEGTQTCYAKEISKK